MADFKKDDKNCVEVNIFVKCEDGSWKKDSTKKDDCKKEDSDACVVVNIYAECEKCEQKKKKCCDEDY